MKAEGIGQEVFIWRWENIFQEDVSLTKGKYFSGKAFEVLRENVIILTGKFSLINDKLSQQKVFPGKTISV